MRGGDEALERTLDEIVVRNRSRGSVCNTAYGSLHRFLTMNADAALDPVLAPAPFARLGGVAAAQILAGVVERKLKPAGRRRDIAGFHGLLFDPAAAGGLCAVLRGEMPRLRLAEALGWMPGTIPELQRRKLLKVEGYEAVPMEAVTSFRSRYAAADEACAWLESPPRGTLGMHTMLRELCGRPTVAGKRITAFWPRSSMAAKLRPLMRADANIHAIGVGKRRETHDCSGCLSTQSV
ncbi:MAG: hypothetical protein M3R64_07245 [Pseudomonadota bacterium]|nr:hypothetical protein [Pseudomonadota bacterium]